MEGNITRIEIASKEENLNEPYIIYNDNNYFIKLIQLIDNAVEVKKTKANDTIWTITFIDGKNNILKLYEVSHNTLYYNDRAYFCDETITNLLKSLAILNKIEKISISKEASELNHIYSFNSASSFEKDEILNIIILLQNSTESKHEVCAIGERYFITIMERGNTQEFIICPHGYIKNRRFHACKELYKYLDERYNENAIQLLSLPINYITASKSHYN